MTNFSLLSGAIFQFHDYGRKGTVDGSEILLTKTRGDSILFVIVVILLGEVLVDLKRTRWDCM